jgi:hypothetical protein
MRGSPTCLPESERSLVGARVRRTITGIIVFNKGLPPLSLDKLAAPSILVPRFDPDPLGWARDPKEKRP